MGNLGGPWLASTLRRARACRTHRGTTLGWCACGQAGLFTGLGALRLFVRRSVALGSPAPVYLQVPAGVLLALTGLPFGAVLSLGPEIVATDLGGANFGALFSLVQGTAALSAIGAPAAYAALLRVAGGSSLWVYALAAGLQVVAAGALMLAPAPLHGPLTAALDRGACGCCTLGRAQ